MSLVELLRSAERAPGGEPEAAARFALQRRQVIKVLGIIVPPLRTLLPFVLIVVFGHVAVCGSAHSSQKPDRFYIPIKIKELGLKL